MEKYSQNLEEVNYDNYEQACNFDDQQYAQNMAKIRQNGREQKERDMAKCGDLLKMLNVDAKNLNEIIELLKTKLVAPVDWVDGMQKLKEHEAVVKIIGALMQIWEEKIQQGVWDKIIFGDLSWQKLCDYLKYNWSNLWTKDRLAIYQLLSKEWVFEAVVDKIGGPIILWVEDRWPRGGEVSRWMHMWVDYNVSVWSAVKSVYDWVVVWWLKDWIPFWNEQFKQVYGKLNDGYYIDDNWNVCDQFWKIVKERGESGWYWSMLLIEHEIQGEKYYSLYGHIAFDWDVEEWMKISKGHKFATVAPFESNGKWNPHLHFSLMSDFSNSEILHWYAKNTEEIPDAFIDPNMIF